MFWVDLTFEWYGDAMAFCVFMFIFLFFFLLKSNVRRGYLDESDFRHCFGNCFESAIPKVSWSQLITTITSSQQLQNNIDNSILKSILELKILRTWIKVHANPFIKTLVNIMWRESTKVPWKLSLEKKYYLVLQRTLHQNRYLTCYYTLLLLPN